jgi:hypothetical protein
MAKILESEFRKELYKNLIDAGYEKSDAQKIVGVKYYDALSCTVADFLAAKADDIRNGRQLEPITDIEKINAQIEELKKLKEIIS